MRKTLATALAAATAATFAAGSATPAHAWGERGHRLINRVAVGSLPADGPTFVQAQIDWIGVRGITPDTWRYPSEPFVKIDEDPNHGWFMEQFAFMTVIPRSRYEFVLALYDEHKRLSATDPAKAALTNVRWTGTLPYAATETFERIKSAMRVYRDLQARQQDTRFIEQDIAFYIGWLGHYVADGGMPLHASVHHDGWQGENPKDYTRDPRIHGRFESQFVELVEAKEEDFRGKVSAPARLDDAFDAMLAYLQRSNARVEAVYQLDREHAYEDKTHAKARALVFDCMADASSMLRNLVYTAWLDSATPLRMRPPATQSGTQPGASTTASTPASGAPAQTAAPAQPTMPAMPLQPMDPRHPRYNPATGSAPAERAPAAKPSPSGGR